MYGECKKSSRDHKSKALLWLWIFLLDRWYPHLLPDQLDLDNSSIWRNLLLQQVVLKIKVQCPAGLAFINNHKPFPLVKGCPLLNRRAAPGAYQMPLTLLPGAVLDLIGVLVDINPVQEWRIVSYGRYHALAFPAPCVVWMGEVVAREQVALVALGYIMRRGR